MGTLATIALVVLGISFMTFVTFFGRLPVLRHTPVAFLHRLIWIYLPNAFTALDQRLTSGRVTSSTARFAHYMMYDKHPTVLIFFFLLLFVGECMYLPTAWPQLSLVHKVTGSVAIVLPYVFLYLATFGDPGTITPSNHGKEMERYPYDFTLFHPGAVCRTCNFLKPARSKHCAICKKCVAKSDHHCIFINNCVGAGNQHWFILLLLTTGLLNLYGGVVGISLITARVRSRFPPWSVWPPLGGGPHPLTLKTWLILWGWGLQDRVGLGSVTLLALLTSPLVFGLLGYQLWLVYCGTTTNESLKWSDWQAEMDDGFAFRRKLPADRPRDLTIEPPWTRWPVESEQILVRTLSGNPPSSDQNLPGVGEWEAVWRLKDVENLYDIGFWDNLVDVFRPGHMFQDYQIPVTDWRPHQAARKKGTHR